MKAFFSRLFTNGDSIDKILRKVMLPAEGDKLGTLLKIDKLLAGPPVTECSSPVNPLLC